MYIVAQQLHGKRILVTRARHQAQGLISMIEASGGEAVAFPVIATADPLDWAPTDAAISRYEQYRWLVLTSPNGVRQFVKRLEHAAVPVASLAHLKVLAVGTATAKAMERYGFAVDVIPGEFRGAAIPQALEQELRLGDRVLLPRGDLADPALPKALRALGAQVDDVVVYRTVPDTTGDTDALAEQLRRGQIDYVTFTSGSTVRFLVQRLGSVQPIRYSRVACIGPETAKVAHALGLNNCLVAQPFTTEALFQAIVSDVVSAK